MVRAILEPEEQSTGAIFMLSPISPFEYSTLYGRTKAWRSC